jgi:hypothetical protein
MSVRSILRRSADSGRLKQIAVMVGLTHEETLMHLGASRAKAKAAWECRMTMADLTREQDADRRFSRRQVAGNDALTSTGCRRTMPPSWLR